MKHSQLGPHITHPARNDENVPDSSKRVLLTGATGYLGGFLLREMLEQGLSVTCLVRADNETSAKRRVIHNLRTIGILKNHYFDKFTVICGDLTAPRFGLDATSFGTLATSTSDVFHSAAAVRFDLSFESLRATNVEGTSRILEFVCHGQPKKLHHISSLAIFFSPAILKSEKLIEAYFPPPPPDKLSGYGQSKWAAERLILQARMRGVKANIYRAGVIPGDSINGYWSPRDLLTEVTRFSLRWGIISDLQQMNGIPVDIVASIVVRSALDDVNDNQTLHILHPKPLAVGEWAEVMGELGMTVELISLAQWISRFLERPESEIWKPVIGRGDLTIYGQILSQFSKFDTKNLVNTLRVHNLKIPEFKTLVQNGWLSRLA